MTTDTAVAITAEEIEELLRAAGEVDRWVPPATSATPDQVRAGHIRRLPWDGLGTRVQLLRKDISCPYCRTGTSARGWVRRVVYVLRNADPHSAVIDASHAFDAATDDAYATLARCTRAFQAAETMYGPEPVPPVYDMTAIPTVLPTRRHTARPPRLTGGWRPDLPVPEQVTPRIDSTSHCDQCQQPITWDELHGWLHTRTPPSQNPTDGTDRASGLT